MSPNHCRIQNQKECLPLRRIANSKKTLTIIQVTFYLLSAARAHVSLWGLDFGIVATMCMTMIL
jgi:hypothetical protein